MKMQKLTEYETPIPVLSDLFDKCIKWALKNGYECNYEGDGKWHHEDDGITKNNKQLFEEFCKTLKK